MNETTANFLKAIQEYKPQPTVPVVIKLTYDPETMYVTGCTFEDTDEPFIIITHEQWKNGFHCRPLKIVNGQAVPIERIRKRELQLVPGSTWFTDRSNMLIIGKDKGWDKK